MVEEVLFFLLFIKIRLKQRVDDSQIVESTQNVSSQSFLDLIDEISLQNPEEERAKLPSDMSKNLDYYLSKNRMNIQDKKESDRHTNK